VQIRGVRVCVLQLVGNTGCAYRLSTLEENIEKLCELGGENYNIEKLYELGKAVSAIQIEHGSN